VVKINQLMKMCNALEEKIDAAANQHTALLSSLMVKI
jgi:hypothetical protein